MTTTELILDYYAAFNAGDMNRFISLLDEQVVHDVNQGERQTGKAAFTAFMADMNRSYREKLTDIVVMASAGGDRAAAEFIVHGEYLANDDGLPPAYGQTYTLAAGAFFAIANGRITRVTNYYNLNEWLRQVGGGN